MTQAPALPHGFELPLEPRIPRIGAIDAVALEARAGELAKRSIKKDAKLFALLLSVRMMDLTTLEGADTPGKVAALCSKALNPDPADPAIPSVAAVCVYPNLVPDRASSPRGIDGQGCVGGDRVPVRPGATRGEAGRRARRRRMGCRRDRHGHRPRRVSLRALREGLRRDRAGEGRVRRRAPQGHPRDRGARHLRQRASRVAARHGRRGGLHQDVDRQDPARRDPAGDPVHARGDPRRPRRDRAHGRA